MRRISQCPLLTFSKQVSYRRCNSVWRTIICSRLTHCQVKLTGVPFNRLSIKDYTMISSRQYQHSSPSATATSTSLPMSTHYTAVAQPIICTLTRHPTPPSRAITLMVCQLASTITPTPIPPTYSAIILITLTT
jgi:hypothetical protein